MTGNLARNNSNPLDVLHATVPIGDIGRLHLATNPADHPNAPRQTYEGMLMNLGQNALGVALSADSLLIRESGANSGPFTTGLGRTSYIAKPIAPESVGLHRSMDNAQVARTVLVLVRDRAAERQLPISSTFTGRRPQLLYTLDIDGALRANFLRRPGSSETAD